MMWLFDVYNMSISTKRYCLIYAHILLNTMEKLRNLALAYRLKNSRYTANDIQLTLSVRMYTEI